MKVNFTSQAKAKFKDGLEEFKRQVDECVKRGDGTITGASPSNIMKIFDEALQEIEYKSNVEFGSGKLKKEVCGVGFVRKDILKDDYVNGSSFTHKKGVYIFFTYNRKDEKFKLCIGIADKEKDSCKAMREIEQKRGKGEFEKQYGSNFDAEIIANDFIEFANDFNRFSVDDFKIIENKGENTTMDKAKIPLNQILYGPPGTGKTYSTIDKALEILALDNNDKENSKIKEILSQLKSNPSDKEARQGAREIFNARKKDRQIEFITFHQSFSYEEFVEGIKPETSENGDNVLYKIKRGIFKEICIKALADFRKPYILIIDEINRGNISKILGELITLIEESKRIGGAEELKVRLPYSTEEFGVPSNLYIIGTMNTADRSIALLDTALRRRFEFVEMMPKPELLKNIWLVRDINKAEETSLDKWEDDAEILFNILTAINNRIEFLLDREHTIGHSFFFEKAKFVESGGWYELSLADLKDIFAKKIIPLLQEYFYEDYAKIDAVLNGNKMVKSHSMKDLKDLGVKFSNEFVDEDKKIYRISNSSEWSEDTFKNIYLKDSGKSNENGE